MLEEEVLYFGYQTGVITKIKKRRFIHLAIYIPASYSPVMG